jgi:hypothetical protein
MSTYNQKRDSTGMSSKQRGNPSYNGKSQDHRQAQVPESPHFRVAIGMEDEQTRIHSSPSRSSGNVNGPKPLALREQEKVL